MRKFKLLMRAIAIASVMPVFGSEATCTRDGVVSDYDEEVRRMIESDRPEIVDRWKGLRDYSDEFNQLRQRREAFALTTNEIENLQEDEFRWIQRSIYYARMVRRELHTYPPKDQRLLKICVLDIEVAWQWLTGIKDKKKYRDDFARGLAGILEISGTDFKGSQLKRLFEALVQADIKCTQLEHNSKASQAAKEQNEKDRLEAWEAFNNFKNRKPLSEAEKHDLSLIGYINPEYAR